jgi:hypothetical protein
MPFTPEEQAEIEREFPAAWRQRVQGLRVETIVAPVEIFPGLGQIAAKFRTAGSVWGPAQRFEMLIPLDHARALGALFIARANGVTEVVPRGVIQPDAEALRALTEGRGAPPRWKP